MEDDNQSRDVGGDVNGSREHTTYIQYIRRAVSDRDISCVISSTATAKSRSYSKLSYFRSILRDVSIALDGGNGRERERLQLRWFSGSPRRADVLCNVNLANDLCTINEDRELKSNFLNGSNCFEKSIKLTYVVLIAT